MASAAASTNVRLSVFVRKVGGGGAQRVMLRLANGLTARGYDVDLVVLNTEGDFEREIDPRVRIVPLEASRLAFCIPSLARYLQQIQPVSMIATEPASNVCLAIAGRLSGTSTRIILREGLFPSAALREDADRSTRLALRAARHVYPLADAIVPIASELRDDLAILIRMPPEALRLIAVNPVVTPELLAAAQEKPAHPWFEDGGPPVVLGVGRLESQKDFETLIRAFARVRNRRVCRLVILGEGLERRRLEVLVHRLGLTSDVSLPGFDPSPFAAMARCGTFVLSSRYEGLPNALIEALACGAPVVSTACPSGPRDILENGRLAPLVPVGDVAAMADAIDAVLDAPPSRRRQQEIGNRYTVERSVDLYLPVLLGHDDD